MLSAPLLVNSAIPVALVSVAGTSSLPVSLASKNGCCCCANADGVVLVKVEKPNTLLTVANNNTVIIAVTFNIVLSDIIYGYRICYINFIGRKYFLYPNVVCTKIHISYKP